MNKLPNSPNFNIVNTKRLGSETNNNKVKPLKVTFDRPDFVIRFPKNKKILLTFPNLKKITIKEDQTPLQRQQLLDLRQELKQRSEGGENNLTIKYIKGVPQIIVIDDSKN